jgi:hypothetical protein
MRPAGSSLAFVVLTAMAQTPVNVLPTIPIRGAITTTATVRRLKLRILNREPRHGYRQWYWRILRAQSILQPGSCICRAGQ